MSHFGQHETMIRPIEAGDVESIMDIIGYWAVNRHLGQNEPVVEDVEQARLDISASFGSTEKMYLAATDDTEGIVGIAGVQPVSDALALLVTSEPAYEILHYYVRVDKSGLGIGTRLLEHIERNLSIAGGKELLVLSGVRCKTTAWGFYDKHFGPAISTVDDYYDTGAPARIWSKTLNNEG